jgi:hypothetical protein
MNRQFNKETAASNHPGYVRGWMQPMYMRLDVVYYTALRGLDLDLDTNLHHTTNTVAHPA